LSTRRRSQVGRRWGGLAAALWLVLGMTAFAEAPSAAANDTGTDEGGLVDGALSLGPVEPLTRADQLALYGRGAKPSRARAAAGGRGCTVAKKRARFHSSVLDRKVFAYWLEFRARFCWDERRRKAVQRGFNDTDFDISTYHSTAGYEVKEHKMYRAFSTRWLGAPKGMAHMNARFKMEHCWTFPWPKCDDWDIYISLHGHYDGSAFEHVWAQK
jgi:hypothetical protein